jgi:hypothetical protein
MASGCSLLATGLWLFTNKRLPALFIGVSIQKKMIISPESKNQKPESKNQKPKTRSQEQEASSQ